MGVVVVVVVVVLVLVSGERIFEYIRIFEYFSPNIRYSNTNIVIF